MNVIDMVEKQQLRTDLPNFKPGDSIKVHVKIKEGDKERIQVFEGRLHRPEARQRPRYLYRAQNVLWAWRRTHFPIAFAGDR